VLVASAGARPGARGASRRPRVRSAPAAGADRILQAAGARENETRETQRRAGRAPAPAARAQRATASGPDDRQQTRGPRCGRAIYKLNRQHSLATVNVSGYTRNTLSGVENSSTSFRSFVAITCRARGCLAAVQDSLLISALRCIIMCESGR
jgi:hypothetical protein